MNLFDFALKEYQMIDAKANIYFSYLYLIMGFTFAFFGAILSIFKDSLFPILDPSNYYTFILVVLYLLPVVTYVLGLFFAYNSVAIYKAGLYLVKLEKRIRKFQSSNHIKSHLRMMPWNIEAKDRKSKFILPYGTMLMLYILLPTAILAFSFYEFHFIKLTRLISVIVVYFLPITFNLTYLVFMVLLIKSMFDYKKRCDVVLGIAKKNNCKKP